MKIKLIALPFIALACAFLASCSEDDSSEIKRYPQAVLNISDATSLALLESTTNGRTKQNESNFYKVTTDGSMEKVKFVNSDGSDLNAGVAEPVVEVQTMVDLDDSFLLLNGIFSLWDTLGNSLHYTSLLVRKTDGAIFDFGQNDIEAQKVKLGDKLIKTDNRENIYYPNSAGVTKLSVENPESISKEDFLPSGQRSDFFDVTPEGVAVYKYGEGEGIHGNGTDLIRVKKLNGGIFEVKVEGRDNNEFWIGTNGQIYFITYTWDNGYQPAIHKIVMDGDVIEIEDLWSNNTFDYPGVGNMFRTFSQGSYKIDKGNSVVFIDTYYGPGYSWEFDQLTNMVTPIELPNIEQGATIVHSDNYYYIATGTDLFKVNLNTHEYSSLLNSGEYEVYSMNVDERDNLQFSGLRFSDGKKIFAEVSSDGTLKVIDEEIGRSATVLQRLN